MKKLEKQLRNKNEGNLWSMKLTTNRRRRPTGYIYLYLINHDSTRGMTIESRGDSSGSYATIKI